jgi:hypothetical protein
MSMLQHGTSGLPVRVESGLIKLSKKWERLAVSKRYEGTEVEETLRFCSKQLLALLKKIGRER